MGLLGDLFGYRDGPCPAETARQKLLGDLWDFHRERIADAVTTQGELQAVTVAEALDDFAKDYERFYLQEIKDRGQK